MLINFFIIPEIWQLIVLRGFLSRFVQSPCKETRTTLYPRSFNLCNFVGNFIVNIWLRIKIDDHDWLCIETVDHTGLTFTQLAISLYESGSRVVQNLQFSAFRTRKLDHNSVKKFNNNEIADPIHRAAHSGGGLLNKRSRRSHR